LSYAPLEKIYHNLLDYRLFLVSAHSSLSFLASWTGRCSQKDPACI